MLFTKSITNKNLSLVSFHADWCGTCQTMTPILIHTKKELLNHIQYLEINIDKKPLIAAAFQIRSVPSLLLFKNGGVLWRHAGLISTKELIDKITNHI